MLTPRETVNLAAFLQLNLGKIEQDMLVDQILDSLGLRHVESMTIGDQMSSHSGTILGSSGGCLSGGERRRLTVDEFKKAR